MEHCKKMVLPINCKPSFITCIHHAYPCAIIESQEQVILQISDFDDKKWSLSTNHIEVKKTQDNIIFSSKDNEVNEFVIWKECESSEELVFNYKYFKRRNKNFYIDIFLFSDQWNDEIKKDVKTCAFRWNMYGVYALNDIYRYDTKRYHFIKIQKNNSAFRGYVSMDGKTWDVIGNIYIPNEEGKMFNRVGLHVYMGKDCFDEWKYTNFVQMSYNSVSVYKGIHLDYYVFPRKNIDNSYGWFNNFLETSYDDLYEVKSIFPTLVDYIKWNVENSYYIALCVDEFYIPERMYYQLRNYLHYNLIYGYDDEQREYYVLGYGVDSVPVCTKVPYDLITYELLKSEKITRYKFNINAVAEYKFDIQRLKTNLEELLSDTDSSAKFGNVLMGDNLNFGLSVIKKIAFDKQEMDRLLDDRRISYFFVEYSRVMRQRVDYLFREKYIDETAYTEITKKCDDIIRLTQLIMFKILRNMVKAEDKTELTDTLSNYLLKLYNAEKMLIKQLLRSIKM